MGGSNYDEGWDIAIDAHENIYVTGMDFANDGSSSAVAARLDENGNVAWYVTFGNALEDDYSSAIVVNHLGNVYVAGFSGGTWGSPVSAYTSGGFVAQLSSGSGALQWNTFLPDDLDVATGVVLDGGHLLVSTSTYFGTINRGYAAKLDTSGSLNWTISLGRQASAVAAANGKIYVSNNFTVFPDNIRSAYVTRIDDPIYDCSGVTLSPIAQAVRAEVEDSQVEYCGNSYDGLITLPPGEAAFTRFRDLAATAEYEVDFVTMGWEQDRDPDIVDSPGDYFIEGIKALYDRVRANPGNHLVRVRILLGLKYYHNLQDQRLSVLNDLADRGIEIQDTNWSVIIATYRDDSFLSGKHSHVKLMIVDGKHTIASGYNMHWNYLDNIPEENKFPLHDMGIEVSGPIAQSALKVFDEMWLGASPCPYCDPITDTSHDPAILSPTITGNNVVFSLFRDDIHKTADNAIEAAMNAAESEVNIIQNRFMNDFWNPHQYASAVLNALQKGDGQVTVNLLVSGAGNETENFLNINDLRINVTGVCNLKDQLLYEDPIGTHHLMTRHSSQTNPIHTKALSIDRTFIFVGSQNFDHSAWGNDNSLPYGDLAEYSLGVSSIAAANEFNNNFDEEFDHTNGARDIVCSDSMFSQSALQNAINQALPGTAIYIPAGVYSGLITVNKPIVLVGAGVNETVFQPQGNEPAFRVTSSNVTIVDVKITGGTSYGIELIDSSPSSLKDVQISRVVFENNAQGGVLAQGLISGSPMDYVIENNMFIGGASGVTINMLETQANTSLIRDNIFSGQSNVPIRILSTNDSRVEYSYNLFDDCGLGACSTNWRLGNMSASSSAHHNLFDLDPLFANEQKGAYQLSPGSPAIDAGDPSLFHDFFSDGDNDGTVQIDMGAFEYMPVPNVTPVVNAGNDQTVNVGSSVMINATYSDSDNTENHSARIDWGDGAIEDVPVNMTGPGAGEVTEPHTYSGPGNHIVEVCIVDLYGGVGCDTVAINVSSLSCTPSDSYAALSGGGAKLASYTSSNNIDFNRLPLYFVPNHGQADAAVKFQAQGLGGKIFFTPGEVTLTLPNPVKTEDGEKGKEKIRYDLRPANVVRIHYQGANENPEVASIGGLPGVVNLLKGNDPSKWLTNLPTYPGIAYRELYPGIELRYEGVDGQLKSTFQVAPGADPSAIVWRYKGVKSLSVDGSGNLVISLPEPAGDGAVLVEQAPIAWQEVNGEHVMVAVRYVTDRKNQKVSFSFPNGYDPSLPLVIDPTLTYSSYLGGGKNDDGHAISLDANCNVYVTGGTSSLDFPTVNQFQTNPPTKDIFISKLNAAGDTLLYSTYLGGNQSDQAWDIALDSQGRITVVGESESSDFPMQNAYDSSFGGGACGDEPCDDVIVAQLNPDGASLRYSTFLGGSQEENGLALAIGPGDKIHLTGTIRSSDFPVFHAFDSSFGGGTCSGAPCYDAFLATVDPALSGSASLLYSTFLGGSDYDDGMDVAVDSLGHVYLSGFTRSTGFPTRTPYQGTRAGTDAFLSKFDTNLSGDASLLYSTFLGGSGDDRSLGIAVNGANQVYLTGSTKSTNFPRSNAFQNTFGGGTCSGSACTDAFITYLNIATNTLVYSGYLGGSHADEGWGVSVDNLGSAYITGFTSSNNFPTAAAIQGARGADSCAAPPCTDAFVTKVNATGNPLVYSTYLAGSKEDYGSAVVLDGLGQAYIVGYTFSTNFPVTPGSFPYVGASSFSDVFVVKIED